MVWKKCKFTGAPEESCAHCNPGRYLPPIKTRGRWQVHNERKSLDTADQQTNTESKAELAEESNHDTPLGVKVRSSLKALRTNLARENKVSPFIIFTNKALSEMVESTPTTLAALGNVEHLTNTQISNYGVAILETISNALEN